jgi:hypothetical protein
MTNEEIHALKVQTNVATKLAQTAMEFTLNLAKSQGLTLDFAGAARAHLNSEVIDNLDTETFAIERDARRAVAARLMEFATNQ